MKIIKKHPLLTDKENNIVFGTPLPEDVKLVKRNLKVKTKLPVKLPKPNYNGLPDGFL